MTISALQAAGWIDSQENAGDIEYGFPNKPGAGLAYDDVSFPGSPTVWTRLPDLGYGPGAIGVFGDNAGSGIASVAGELLLFEGGYTNFIRIMSDVTLFGSGKVVVGSSIASSPRILTAAGDPEGALNAPLGSVYIRTTGGAGTSLYVKELADIGGDTKKGWAAK